MDSMFGILRRIKSALGKSGDFSLNAVYTGMGARKMPNGKIVLPEPEDPQRAAILNEEAIAIIRSNVVYKRVNSNPKPRELEQAFILFGSACGLNFGVTPETYNFGCCCYYVNLWQNGKMYFDMLVDQFHQGSRDPESQRVIEYFAAFHNYVVLEHLHTWLSGHIVVNPDFFMSRKTPSASPPKHQERQEFDPDVLI